MSVLDKFNLSGCTALVTGAGRGIGRALALALAEVGADVAVADVDPDTAKETSEDIEDLKIQSLSIQADVTRTDDVQIMVDAVMSAWNRLDIAVNNAGIAQNVDADAIKEDDWDHMLAVNLKSVYLCCREEARVMLPNGAGSIINTASMSAQIVNRPQNHAHYNASKAAVVGLTKSCAAEWAPKGLRVNCLSPGHILTPMTQDMPDEAKAIWIANTPMARLGTVADLEGAVIYLASPASAYVTGHDLVIDGGYTLW